MKHPQTADFRAILDVLLDARVEHIIIGGVAAILHGSPSTTRDLDVIHRREPENVARLLAALARIDAYIREPGIPAPAKPGRLSGGMALAEPTAPHPGDRRLRPDADLLLRGRQPLFSTSLGPLDTLCVLNDGRGYDELLPHTELMTDGPASLRVLDLDTLIEVKAAANRPKDRIVLPILLALRDVKLQGRTK